MCETCERYDVNLDRWAKFPALSVGRAFHSSSGFEGRYVFVLCGLIVERSQIEVVSEEDHGMTIIKEELHWRMTNSIERLDSFYKHKGWLPIEITDNTLSMRRSPGVVQISLNEILIFGGHSSDKELKAVYFWNVPNNSIRRIVKKTDKPINPGQRPVVLAIDSSVVTGESGTTNIYFRLKNKPF